ncbi:glycosyltransferase family 9 protein [Rugamonas sp.]|uniref:glycosyltransferase family 9 protein n=1 Tax=Rugamonas sp. TaxID=1926287 RepID=UPI0025E0819B|nr:glycosyltransferase family 9 protein [Rugamonas sp.]
MNFINNLFGSGQPIDATGKRVVIAKTTQLGDLLISLPMAAALKKKFPSCTIILLTNRSTVDIARHCSDVDEVYGEPASGAELLELLKSLNIDIFIKVSKSRALARAARQAHIPVRIGSLFSLHNLWFATRFVVLSTSLSGLNKRLIDLQYLMPFGIRADDLRAIRELRHLTPPKLRSGEPAGHPRDFAGGRRTIILSPTLITARAHQWPLESYSELIRSLSAARFQWFICGTPDDRATLLPLIRRHAQDANVTNLVGKLSLAQFMSFMAECDGLVAGSTGPLHLAAALGIHTLGLFQSRKVDIERWHPVGRSASIIYSDIKCHGERRVQHRGPAARCPCIVAIDAHSVAHRVSAWFETAEVALPQE